jgi:hypothetical protein
MKETCGYLDSKGHFHKTIEECEEAESLIRIETLRRKLGNFEQELENYLRRNTIYSGSRNYDTEAVLDIVAKCVLHNSDMFLEIIAKKQEYQIDLDVLEKQYNEKSYKPWYLRLKWW